MKTNAQGAEPEVCLALRRALASEAARYPSVEAWRAAALARCDREIAEAERQHDAPAWLVALWAEDWERERRSILGFGGCE